MGENGFHLKFLSREICQSTSRHGIVEMGRNVESKGIDGVDEEKVHFKESVIDSQRGSC